MPLVLSNPKTAQREPDLAVPPSAPDASRCWAVVSFVFEDACWCDWLYREFDGERVPRSLHGRPSRDGLPYPERFSVSPDPADPVQLEHYAETLQTAQHLIIIVSPGSARTEVIQEHMRMFKAKGGEERIIALVVKGEPASPAAEPGSEADREWLPKWLQWRFENNAFAPAGRDEPTVVDARLGVSSLAEVRARLFASMLEVNVSQLAELGVIIRASPSERVLNGAQQQAAAPRPRPAPVSQITLTQPDAAPSHSRWPVALCGAAALAALGCLAFWPAPDSRQLPPLVAAPAPAQQSHASDSAAASIEKNAVAVVVAPVQAAPALQEARPEPPATQAANTPQSAPSEPAAAAPPEPAATAQAERAAPPQVDIPIEDPTITRKRAELAGKRDRLIRLAETKMAAGDRSEALEVFELAIESAKEIVRIGNNDHNSVVELAILYRRLGTLASNVNSSAEARGHFESGRKTLVALRAGGHLPKEGAKVLAELENSIHRLPKD